MGAPRTRGEVSLRDELGGATGEEAAGDEEHAESAGGEQVEEAADAGGGLQGLDGVAVVREGVDQRGDEAGVVLRNLARRVKPMGEFLAA